MGNKMFDEFEKKICDEHGEYDAKLMNPGMAGKPRYSLCPKCMEANAEWEKKVSSTNKKEEDFLRKISAKANATLPERYEDATFNSFEVKLGGQEEAKFIAKNYCDYFKNKDYYNLILYGYVGTGKTLLAVAMANELIDKGYSVKYSSVGESTDKLRNSYNRDASISYREIIDEYSRYDLLIIDEVGVQNNTDWELKALYEFVNSRYEKKCPIVVIANIKPEDTGDGADPDKVVEGYLIRHLGDRVVDRLRENDGQMIFFNWGSYRRKTYRK